MNDNINDGLFEAIPQTINIINKTNFIPIYIQDLYQLEPFSSGQKNLFISFLYFILTFLVIFIFIFINIYLYYININARKFNCS